jgi:Flp pilus assembly protein TadD
VLYDYLISQEYAMKLNARKICRGVVTVLAIAFAIKTFLYGGSTSSDPNDSPLYESTLTRALNNFKDSNLVLGQGVVPSSSLYDSAASGESQDHTGHNHPPVGQGDAGLGQAPQAQDDHGCSDMRAGLQFMQQGRFREAAASFEIAAKCLTDDTCVQTYLRTMYDKLGEKDKSRQAQEKAAALKPAQPGLGLLDPNYLIGLNVAPEPSLSDPAAAAAAPPQSQDHTGHDHPPVGQADAAPAQSQDHTGHNHPPVGQGDAGLGQAPQAQEDHGCKDMRAGLQLMQQGRVREAAASFEVAAQCLSNDPCVQTYLGMMYDKMGEKEKSRRAHEKAAVLKNAQPGAGVQNPNVPVVGQP